MAGEVARQGVCGFFVAYGGDESAWAVDGLETLREMEEMVAEGISSFKLFMAYPNVLMVNDELMFRVMQKAAALMRLCLIHAENGSAIDVVVAQMIAEGKTEPHYHALSRSEPEGGGGGDAPGDCFGGYGGGGGVHRASVE